MTNKVSKIGSDQIKEKYDFTQKDKSKGYHDIPF